MLVLMLETRRGSPDGLIIRQYHEGQEYDLSRSLASYFIKRYWAMQCDLNSEDMAAFLAKRVRHYEALERFHSGPKNGAEFHASIMGKL